ncbi:MAG: hypothetical protein QM736_06535 [Vicinamibacterales bacterium]
MQVAVEQHAKRATASELRRGLQHPEMHPAQRPAISRADLDLIFGPRARAHGIAHRSKPRTDSSIADAGDNSEQAWHCGWFLRESFLRKLFASFGERAVSDLHATTTAMPTSERQGTTFVR